MVKRTPIIGKYCGRAFSTISSSSLYSSIKHRWGEQGSLGVWVAFLSGYFGHGIINLNKRREQWYKVKRMLQESDKREEEQNARTRAVIDSLMRKHESST